MRYPVPVDLMGIAQKVQGNLDLGQSVSLGMAGVAVLAAVSARAPYGPALLFAGTVAGYSILEIDGLPVRHVLPRIVRYALRRRLRGAQTDEDPLWLSPRTGRPHVSIPGFRCTRRRSRRF